MKLLPIFLAMPDLRRRQGCRYDLPHVLLFSVMAVLSGASSYRTMASFISIHFDTLKTLCHLKWKRPPAHTTLSNILRGLDSAALEICLRQHAASLSSQPAQHIIAIDGKSLRGSFDHVKEQRAAMLVSAFSSLDQLVLGHVLIDGTEKTNEIPAAQQLIATLGLTGKLFSLDAMHCQKNHFDSP